MGRETVTVFRVEHNNAHNCDRINPDCVWYETLEEAKGGRAGYLSACRRGDYGEYLEPDGEIERVVVTVGNRERIVNLLNRSSYVERRDTLVSAETFEGFEDPQGRG